MHGRSDKIRLSTGDGAAGAARPGQGEAEDAGEGSAAAGPPCPGGGGDREDDEAWRCAARPGGYAWWYVDVSDERHTLTVILFAGGVFSPAYAARVRGGADDSGLLHPAVHAVLLDGDRTQAWVMNEYDPGCLKRLPGGIQVAGSSLRRERDGSVRVQLEERRTRFFGLPGGTLAGEIRIRPAEAAGPGVPAAREAAARQGDAAAMHAPLRLSRDGAEGHFWRPRLLGGRAEAELRLGGETLRLSGAAYHDGNYGEGRLERAFSRWSWAHGTDPRTGRAVVLYDVAWRGGGGRGVLLDEDRRVLVGGEGAREAGAVPGPRWLRAPAAFRLGPWRCERRPGALLDAPFYARYRARLASDGGAAYDGVGEYLDLERFSSRTVQLMLRFKTWRGAAPRPEGPP